MNPNPNTYDGGPISTIFDVLDEKQRKKLDNAIITRNPSSLTKVHEIFHLAEKGISQQTLYRYARKIRDQGNKITLLESTFTSEVDVVEHLKNQIGRQCMDMILNADVNGITPLDAQRIAHAFGKCLQYDLIIARTKALEAATADQSRERKRPVSHDASPDPGYGRNEDGSPKTHEQYCATVKQVLFEVYAPKSVKEAAAREAAAREAAEKAAAAKQNPDNPPLVREPAEIDASGPGRAGVLAPTTDGIPSVPPRRDAREISPRSRKPDDERFQTKETRGLDQLAAFGVAHSAQQADDAFDDAPEMDDAAAHAGHAEEQKETADAHEQHQHADAEVAEVKPMGAKAAQQDSQQSRHDAALGADRIGTDLMHDGNRRRRWLGCARPGHRHWLVASINEDPLLRRRARSGRRSEYGGYGGERVGPNLALGARFNQRGFGVNPALARPLHQGIHIRGAIALAVHSHHKVLNHGRTPAAHPIESEFSRLRDWRPAGIL
jgi:hypothetical protein